MSHAGIFTVLVTSREWILYVNTKNNFIKCTAQHKVSGTSYVLYIHTIYTCTGNRRKYIKLTVLYLKMKLLRHEVFSLIVTTLLQQQLQVYYRLSVC